MATFSERYNDSGELIGYQVRIRRQGHPQVVRTFGSLREARDFAKVTEAEMIRGRYVDRSKAERTALGEVIVAYIENVAPAHKGGHAEILRLKRFLREEAKLCAYSLTNLRTTHFEDFMRRRLEEVSPGTVKRELGLLHSVIEGVRKAYGMVENPISDVRRPQVNDARDVRLHEAGEAALLKAIEKTRNPWLRPAVILAIETAMRRSELLALHWVHVDLDELKLHLTDWDTGEICASATQVAKLTGYSVSSINRALSVLKTGGHLERVASACGKKTTYRLLRRLFARAADGITVPVSWPYIPHCESERIEAVKSFLASGDR